VISHEWCGELTDEIRTELDRLLGDAAQADAEAGFSSFSLDDRVPEGTRYLLIWLLPDERTGRAEDPPTLAGCLRLEPGVDGDAEARLVIRPEFRSRGITTMLCERVGLGRGGPDGWAGSGWSGGVHSWARGNHPAAQRLVLRFGSGDGGSGPRRTRREWRLVVPLTRDADLETLAGVRELPPEVAAELRDRADEPGYDVEATLAKALVGLREAGALIGSYTVDDRQRTVLAACRALGFQHDRTDVRYDLG
jgi:mycothiol synthase